MNIALLVLAAFATFVLAIWVKEDARSRGKPGWLAALMVLSAGCIPGLLIWLVFRPERRIDAP